MRSLSAIAVSKNTNLSVVAPGIAEALFATAIGLVAAIRPHWLTTSLALNDLAPRLSAISENKMDRRVFVRDDKGVNYGRIMETMAAITLGGLPQ